MGVEAVQFTAADVKPYHLATWQDGGKGLVDEDEVNAFENPMQAKYANYHFLHPEEKVRGHLIMNDSKSASRSRVLNDGCVRGNACRKVYWQPSSVKAGLV